MADELAIIKTGGKQYIVKPGATIYIEKIPQKEGESVVFNDVLLIANNGEAQIGTPIIQGAKVTGTVVQEGRGKKLIIFKFRSKKRSKSKQGHRQPFCAVKITKVEV